ncbi:MAG TPA: LPS assembly protein LptD [Verrucomicrobiae bacterium]|nr:LPS assembly protein LptD [Verrucomicrobiae bacterium]
MTSIRLFIALCCLLSALTVRGASAELAEDQVEIVSGDAMFDLTRRIAVVTNSVVIRSQGAVLTAERVVLNERTGDVSATGKVRIQQDAMIWTGDHIEYNFKTRQMMTERFRAGRSPVFARGQGLQADLTNQVYTATNALITADDVWEPAIGIRASHIRIVPGKRIEATHATLYAGGVPIFYFPFYVRSLGPDANNLNVTPGYRSRFGPYLLGTYTWIANEHLDGEFHLDYRQKRGVGVGPDVNVHLGRWGDAALRYYYTRDDDPRTNGLLAPVRDNRQRFDFSYQANPFTNFNVKSMVRYQNDPGVIRDFFESDYRDNPQPNTFVEVNRFWQNFSLDVLAQPRINTFYETVERLPDVRLSGFRQQLGATPIYYESESSAGFYRRLLAETNNIGGGLNYEAARADTYHQLLLPHTFFGWLNVTPRAGGRLTYYSEVNGPGEDIALAGSRQGDVYRGVFNTGAEVSFKASRVWPALMSKPLDLDGLRHIVVPSANYVFVSEPNYRPSELPQFDYEFPSLRLLPNEFPDYNAIDAVDSRNVIRFGLRNKLQTHRETEVVDVLDWQLYTDWRLRPRTTEAENYRSTFSDIYSDLSLRPRSWLTLQSQTRYDINEKDWTMALHNVSVQPNDRWSFSVGHFFLRSDHPDARTWLGQGNNIMRTTLYYRVNENWGLRASHYYDVSRSQLREQFYTVYRDLRSWTAALTVGMRDEFAQSDDFLIAFTFSLKAAPRFGLGSDTIERRSLLGR